jgi:hypothetical protein
MRVAAVLMAVLVAACVPPPESHSVDLTAIRIGAERGVIERAVGASSQSEATEGRVVAIYRYGPHVEPGRAMACQPLTLGMRLSCAIISSGKAMLDEKAAEERAEALGESLLEVIYSPDGRAEWVVFAGSPAMLARMDQMIALAECGDNAAQAEIASSYVLGGFPLQAQRH